MRVIAGSLKGHRLVTPAGLGTRPMTSRAREALFSSLGSVVEGAAVLDLFAGSGSLGIEALSRGAAHATFVEKQRAALRSLRSNLESTGMEERATIIAGDALTPPAAEGSYDIVFIDPPYDMPRRTVEALLADLVTALRPAASVVLHRRTGEPAPEAPPQLTAGGERRYGDSVLWRYTRD